MPTYTSSWNGKEARTLMGCGIYPIKFSESVQKEIAEVKGPAIEMKLTGSEEEQPQDILDEVIYYFKAKMMLATFPMEGAGDRLSLYLTLYIQQMIYRLLGVANLVRKEHALQVLVDLAKEPICGVGDAKYPFNAMYPQKFTPEEKKEWNLYILQLRLELAQRIYDHVFAFPDEVDIPEKERKPTDKTTKWQVGNKFWLVFGKRPFMGHAFEKGRL